MYLECCFDLQYLPTGTTGCVGRSRGYSSAFQSVCCVSVMFRVCVLMCTGYGVGAVVPVYLLVYLLRNRYDYFVGHKVYFCQILCFSGVY